MAAIQLPKFKMPFEGALAVSLLLHLLLLMTIGLFAYSQTQEEVPFQLVHIKLGNLNAPSTDRAHKKAQPKAQPMPQQVQAPSPQQTIAAPTQQQANNEQTNKPKEGEVKTIEERLQKKMIAEAEVTPKKAKKKMDEPSEEALGQLETAAGAPAQQVTAYQPLLIQPQPHKPANVFAPAQAARGERFGNKNLAMQEKVQRYTETLSLWLNKHTVYPPEAQQRGLYGDAIVLITIDRDGNILNYSLRKSTGSPMLDNAALYAIEYANPVPPLPIDYPQGPIVDFSIPINFSLERG